MSGEKRKFNECPCCRAEGDIDFSRLTFDDNGNYLVYAGKATHWKCEICNMHWDINEEFTCVICGKDVPGRFLLCGDPECEKKFEVDEND